MSIEQQKADNDDAEAILAASVMALLNEHGVPNSFDAMWNFVQNLFPEILAARRVFYNNAVRAMGRDMLAKGLEVSPAPIREYAPNAVFKLLLRALGWNKNQHPIDGPITELDKETQRQLTEQVVTFPEDPFDEEVIEQVGRRISKAAITHAQQAGRDAAVDTAEKNLVRTADTKQIVSKSKSELPDDAVKPDPAQEDQSDGVDTWRPERPTDDEYVTDFAEGDGVVLGWARVLTGDESCSFCAMLASRGPVYKKQTALTRGNGTRYHDNCDCIAVLVVKGQHWEGHNQFRALQKLWYDSYENPTDDSEDARKVFSERYQDLIEADPEMFAVDVHASGVPGVQLPELIDDEGNKVTAINYFGDEPEPIPSLRTLIKHSTWGWNRNDPQIKEGKTKRLGHHFESNRRKGTFYPENWDDQKIADAIATAIADPDMIGTEPIDGRDDINKRIVVKDVDGVLVKVLWKLNDKGKTESITAYPLAGPGVTRWNRKLNRRVEQLEPQPQEISKLKQRRKE